MKQSYGIMKLHAACRFILAVPGYGVAALAALSMGKGEPIYSDGVCILPLLAVPLLWGIGWTLDGLRTLAMIPRDQERSDGYLPSAAQVREMAAAAGPYRGDVNRLTDYGANMPGNVTYSLTYPTGQVTRRGVRVCYTVGLDRDGVVVWNGYHLEDHSFSFDRESDGNRSIMGDN